MGSSTNCGKSRSKVDIALFRGKFAFAIATALGFSLTSIKMTSMCSAWSGLHLEKRTTVLAQWSPKLQKFLSAIVLMELEAIPGLSEVNSEFHSMVEEFSGHVAEQGDVNDSDDEPSTSDDLDRNVEDREEEAIVRRYFDGNPCCSLGPKKSACWSRVGQERLLAARQESMDLEKKDLDMAVLATLRATRAFTSTPSTSREVVRASIKYQYGGVQVCKTAFMFIHAIGARRLKNLISHYDEHGLSERVHGNTRKPPHNRTDGEEIQKIKEFIE